MTYLHGSMLHFLQKGLSQFRVIIVSNTTDLEVIKSFSVSDDPAGQKQSCRIKYEVRMRQLALHTPVPYASGFLMR